MKKTLFLLALLMPLAAWAQEESETARELFDAGLWRAARQELLREREAATGLRLARVDYMLAECTARMGDIEGALRLIGEFEERYPESGYATALHTTAGLCLFGQEDWGGALAEFEKAGGTPSGNGLNSEYWFKRGYAEFMIGRTDEATGSFSRVGERSDYAAHAAYYTGYIHYLQGRYGAAGEIFKTLAGNAVYAPVVPFYLLNIQYQEGNYAYVTTNGDALLARAAGSRRSEIARIMAEAWYHNGDHVRTRQYINTYRETGGEMGREEYYLLGYAEYMAGRPREAVAALEKVVGADDRLSQNAAYHMGAALIERGDKRAAMQSFSIAASGEDATIAEDALFNYGKLQFELGGGVFNEAINVLSRYIADYPQSPRVGEATELLASAYYNARDYEAAYNAIKRIPNPDNNLRAALQKIAYFRALDLYNDGRQDEAFAMLNESLGVAQSAKYSALANFWQGEILYGRGDWAGAATRYRNYMAVSPPSEREYRMAMYNLGYVYFNRGDWAASRSQFDKFIAAYAARDGYRADAYNRLGDIDLAGREFWRAIEMYDNAAKIGTDEKYYSQFQRAMMLGHVDRMGRKIESLNDIIRLGQGGYVDDAVYELGQAYIVGERFRDAATTLRRYVDTYPSGDRRTAALAALGLVYQNLDDSDAAVNYYKMVVTEAPASAQSRDAMLALRSIYVERNDVDGYFAFARSNGVETDLGAVQRDSLAFAAAQNAYLQSGGARGAEALRGYLDRYPRGAYRADALYYAGEGYAAAGRTDDALKSYTELNDMHYNAFTVRGLERLAPMHESAGRVTDAAAAWKKLTTAPAAAATLSRAWAGYLANIAVQGNDALTDAVANEVVASASAPDDVKRQARMAKAGVAERRGDMVAALALYRELSVDPSTAEGAGATVKVVEALYAAGDLDGAQDLVMRFARQGGAHRYELARAFLVLGDIYAKKGDTFQARATLQSIIDGYSNPDDGVIAAARERISKL